MALAFTHLANGSTTSTAPAVTSSVAFANNVLYIVHVSTAGTGSDITGITGGGITWAKVNSTANSSESCGMWRGIVGSGASTGTLSISGTGTLSRVNYEILSVTGSAATVANNGSDAIQQSAVMTRLASQTSSAVTLSTFADGTNNAALQYVYVHLSTETITKEAGHTSLFVNAGTGISDMASYQIGQDLSCTSTWTSTGTVMAVAAEVKMLVAAPTTTSGPLLLGVG